AAGAGAGRRRAGGRPARGAGGAWAGVLAELQPGAAGALRLRQRHRGTARCATGPGGRCHGGAAAGERGLSMDRHHLTVAELAEARLDPAAALEFVSDPGFGGITMFVGRVRDLNHGRDVTGISYDMFVPLALNGFAEIAAKAERDFG